MASFGLTLASRAGVLGEIPAGEPIERAQPAEASGAFHTVRVGASR